MIAFLHQAFSRLVNAFHAAAAALTGEIRSSQELERLNQRLGREAEERLAMEQELRRSHATLDAIVRASPLSIVAVDRDGNVTLWNPAAEALFGWSKSEVIGRPTPHVPPSERATFEQVHRPEAAITLQREVEVRRQTKSGGTIEVAAWTAPLVVDDEVIGGLYIVGDITERKKLERERAQIAEMLELRVAERTAELKQANQELLERNRENELFVYSVSHDLRSPLVNLQGFSEELRRSCGEIREILADSRVPADRRQQGEAILDGDVEEAVHYIQTAVKSLSDILMALLKLSRAGRMQYEHSRVDLQALVSDVVKTFAADNRNPKASTTINIHSSVWADPTAIQQVFSQLVSNALRYCRPDLPPQIEIGELPHADGAGAPVDEGRYRTYYIRDNGLGIPAQLQPKVFQAFQRLHPQATAGEGIGLALSRRIIERHGGKIWFESEVGQGSTFYVALPLRQTADPREISD